MFVYLSVSTELGQSLSDFGKAVKILGACAENSLGKAFSELGTKSEMLSIKLQNEAHNLLMNFEEPLKDYVRAVRLLSGEPLRCAFLELYNMAEDKNIWFTLQIDAFE
ncbi:hypothetical protein HHK36_016860 [Tetracentron sinense]|uniref:Uncharacterized protein n=1 Tax=Tetracentron sinense TaxID=13715 RepID=A0A834YY35_TETSI|nr:hypothetical protein HHK36_016860 [Tetracentron sinense]